MVAGTSTACAAKLIGVAPAHVSLVGGVGTHTLARQMFPDPQAWPQAPQLAGSLVTLAQVPVPEQNVVPAVQMALHVPAEQAVPAAQTCPHVPQLRLLVSTLISQPSLARPLQLANPGLHAPIPHAPERQPAAAFGGAVQTVPHAPQSETVVLRFVSQPLVVTESQFPYPALQLPMPHAPPTHAAVEFAYAVQTVPQAPQLVTVVRRSTSHPSERVWLQSPKPGSHDARPQTPAVHPGSPLGGVVQRIPHVPQLVGSVWVATHAPEQSVVPPEHTEMQA